MDARAWVESQHKLNVGDLAIRGESDARAAMKVHKVYIAGPVFFDGGRPNSPQLPIDRLSPSPKLFGGRGGVDV